jgi:hypothetical protein
MFMTQKSCLEARAEYPANDQRLCLRYINALRRKTPVWALMAFASHGWEVGELYKSLAACEAAGQERNSSLPSDHTVEPNYKCVPVSD